MPVRIVCRQCKSVIFEDPELISPKEIIEKCDSKCPKCGEALVFDPSKLMISVTEKNKKGLLKIFQK